MPQTPIGIAELSRKLHLPAGWIKDEAMAGRLPHLKVGRRLIFEEQAVRTELARRAAREGVRHEG